VDKLAKMEPPIQTEYFRSGGAIILIFMVEQKIAQISEFHKKTKKSKKLQKAKKAVFRPLAKHENCKASGRKTAFFAFSRFPVFCEILRFLRNFWPVLQFFSFFVRFLHCFLVFGVVFRLFALFLNFL